MGNIDLVRPLGLAGIRCAVAAPRGHPVFHSRFVCKASSWEEDETNDDARIEALLRFGAAQREPPVLFYEGDSQLLLVSRHREALAQGFRFVIADSTIVEDLTDKARFQALAARLDLPIPTALLISASSSSPSDIDLRFPIVIKPTQHRGLDGYRRSRQGLVVNTVEDLKRLWRRLAAADLDLMVQEAIPGPECCIESYHVYADQRCTTVAEFTGRKIRTFPLSCGHNTALETTD